MCSSTAPLGTETKTPLKSAMASFTGGFASRVLLQPFDVVKIRLQIDPSSRRPTQGKLFKLVMDILREEGVTAFWKGHLTSQMLTASFVVVQFEAYESANKTLISIEKKYFNGTPFVGLTTRNLICGSFASLMATLVSYPLDVMRTRMVTQLSSNRTYRGITHGIVNLIRSEGFHRLWRGASPGLCLMTLSGASTFGSIAILEKRIGSDSPGKTLATGFLSGAFSKFAFYPLDVVKKRLQVQGFKSYQHQEQVTYKGMTDCAVKIFTSEGLSGLYKGAVPSMLKTGLQTGIIVAFYKWTRIERRKPIM